ncbi:MAG TPA: 2OG-Fe(II) oxygenase [Blastocatellia bacterium]|nr:2OG-Fe(II) oxygenase [Blastocatellia bacterium]
MIDITRINRATLETQPYSWASIGELFPQRNAVRLAKSYPRDHFKTVSGFGGEKDYLYESRSLIGMGSDTISYPECLSRTWIELARDLLSPEYRIAMSLLTARDLTLLPMETNVLHYGPGGLQGPHPDLPDKVVTHVLYFNRWWDQADGGCLHILGSSDPSDIAAEIEPVVGNSAVLVRSPNSWHAVSRVREGCNRSRRSVTVTFYRHGSISTMWPPGDAAPLHYYDGFGA